MQKPSTVARVLLVAATAVNNLPELLDLFDLETTLAAALVIGGAFAIGYLLAGPDRESREVLGLGTGQRNIAAATVVATQVVEFAGTITMVVFTALVALAMLFAVARVLRRRGERTGRARAGRVA